MEKSFKPVSEESSSRRLELTEELKEIETKISEAVELEDYDLAGIFAVHTAATSTHSTITLAS